MIASIATFRHDTRQIYVELSPYEPFAGWSLRVKGEAYYTAYELTRAELIALRDQVQHAIDHFDDVPCVPTAGTQENNNNTPEGDRQQQKET